MPESSIETLVCYFYFSFPLPLRAILIDHAPRLRVPPKRDVIHIVPERPRSADLERPRRAGPERIRGRDEDHDFEAVAAISVLALLSD